METDPEPTHDEPDAAGVAAPAFDLLVLQRCPVAELLARAAARGVPATDDRQALVFALATTGTPPGTTGTGEGILQLHPEGFGFLRSPLHDCRAGADDVFVSANQIRRLGLREGQRIAGEVRTPRPGEGAFALARVTTVDGRAPRLPRQLPPFAWLRAVLPRRRLPLGRHGTTCRMVDLLAPLGAGHRVLLEAGPGTRRTRVLHDLAQGLAQEPAPAILALLLDQRPEDLAEFRRGLDPAVEVFASTFAEPAERHVELMRLVHARTQRLVEAGRDVVLLVDSLTQLVHACNQTVPHSGRVLAAGLDAQALRLPKEVFCAARQTEEGPSCTVIATLLLDGGSHRGRAIADEFAARANARIVLDPDLDAAGDRPPIDVHATRSGSADDLLDPDAFERRRALRAELAGMPSAVAWRELRRRIDATADNDELLAGVPAP